MLVVGGVFDAEDCFGAWNLYKAIDKQSPATNNRLVMGPWYHEQWRNNDGTHHGNIQFGSNTSEWYANHIEIPFFNFTSRARVLLTASARRPYFLQAKINGINYPNGRLRI